MIGSMAGPPRKLNPFYYGDLALDEAFTDRQSELKSLKADMRNGQNVALIAPRRYGKSSLVRRATQQLVAEGVLVAEIDLMKTPTKEKLASALARSIHRDLAKGVVTKAKERARDQLNLFSSLRIAPTITINPEDFSYSFSFSASTAREEDIDATLERLLELPAQLAAEQKKRVVLYFDEFQEITDIDAKLPTLMRAVFQEQPEVAHVYAGSKREMMRRLFSDRNEPFYRSAKVMEIGAIPRGLFKKFVKARFDSTDRGVSDAVLDELLDVTGGHPYGTQELAYALWEEVPEGFTATATDLEAALGSVLRAENAHFALLWEKVSRAQRLVLQALATEPGRVQSSGYRDRFGLPAASTVQRAIEALTRDELVARRPDGAHEIIEPFLGEWVIGSTT
jgi:AAA+ ATPase superfamily predicted ATPase